MKEITIMKMISRRDFLKASAVVGATAAMTACGGSSSTSTAASSVASSTASNLPTCAMRRLPTSAFASISLLITS